MNPSSPHLTLPPGNPGDERAHTGVVAASEPTVMRGSSRSLAMPTGAERALGSHHDAAGQTAVGRPIGTAASGETVPRQKTSPVPAQRHWTKKDYPKATRTSRPPSTHPRCHICGGIAIPGDTVCYARCR
jgi:hypothetical protein